VIKTGSWVLYSIYVHGLWKEILTQQRIRH